MWIGLFYAESELNYNFVHLPPAIIEKNTEEEIIGKLKLKALHNL